ncbi:MAG: hypothetical protein H0W42_05545 [Gemmatimonadaceae bacterium]|nr:hypothetical protein [Gemmatimonadaceae bacterium]
MIQMLRASGFTVALLCAALSAPRAQTPRSVSPVAEAVRLRDAGDLAGAAARLRPYVREHPEDIAAARVLGQTLYWLKDFRAAREIYEDAFARAPNDTALRLEFGRMLVETREDGRAKEILTPLLDVPEASTRANALLGTLAYWQGDYSTARRRFSTSLRADPDQPEVRRQLLEIASATAPWIQVEGNVRDDDQPVTWLGTAAEGGAFLTPSTTISGRAEAMDLRSGDSVSVRVTMVEGGVTHYAPAARMDFEAQGGVVQRSSGGPSEWVGRLGLGLRMPRHLTLRARAERRPYFYTIASLATPVISEGVVGVLGLDHPRGWTGEAAMEGHRYQDGNVVRGAYAWMLAPVLRGAAAQISAGYSLSAQNADETRFVAAVSPPPASAGGGAPAGRYVPYYTPGNLLVQSVLATMVVRPAPGTTLRLNGAYGVRATDDEPAAAEPRPRRSFSPWSARAAIELGQARALSVVVTAEMMRHSYYTSSTADVRMVYRFFALSQRRADRR